MGGPSKPVIAVSLQLKTASGTSPGSLVTDLVLTKQTEGKSARTFEFYREDLKRFLWYGERQQ